LFVVFLGISNSFLNDFISLIVGFAGLGIGLMLNNVLIIPFQFYRISKRILAILYLFFSISLFGFFMGVPVFNILLGVLAGNYLSIRVFRNRRSNKEIKVLFFQGALFTSFVILLVSSLSVWLALIDIENTQQTINEILQLHLNIKQLNLIIFIGGILLVILQYFLTLFTAQTMLSFRRKRKLIN